ncbi:hypothetical protein [uncultured Bilophila sp.]|uniref:hypothetical protein n=1 Tax=uncultured Bilophila sp. TaxID=529385 RepID=UPI00280B109B|nr:hypothetical protein [uncultured Bilophila sp.]
MSTRYLPDVGLKYYACPSHRACAGILANNADFPMMPTDPYPLIDAVLRPLIPLSPSKAFAGEPNDEKLRHKKADALFLRLCRHATYNYLKSLK